MSASLAPAPLEGFARSGMTIAQVERILVEICGLASEINKLAAAPGNSGSISRLARLIGFLADYPLDGDCSGDEIDWFLGSGFRELGACREGGCSMNGWPFMYVRVADWIALDDYAKGQVEGALNKAIRDAAMEMVRAGRVRRSEAPVRSRPSHLKLVSWDGDHRGAR